MPRAKLRQAADCDLQYLDPRYDEALVGWAERREDKRAVYDYCGCYRVELARHKDPARALATVTSEVFRGEGELAKVGPLVRFPIQREAFWRRAKDKEFPVWEHLTLAIDGVVGTSPAGAKAVLYDYPKTIEILLRITEDSRAETSEEGIQAAVAYFNTRILPACLGESTPFFLHRAGITQPKT